MLVVVVVVTVTVTMRVVVAGSANLVLRAAAAMTAPMAALHHHLQLLRVALHLVLQRGCSA